MTKVQRRAILIKAAAIVEQALGRYGTLQYSCNAIAKQTLPKGHSRLDLVKLKNAYSDFYNFSEDVRFWGLAWEDTEDVGSNLKELRVLLLLWFAEVTT